MTPDSVLLENSHCVFHIQTVPNSHSSRGPNTRMAHTAFLKLAFGKKRRNKALQRVTEITAQNYGWLV